MRILALLHSPVGSGSDTTIRRIAAHLITEGHSVHLEQFPADPGELARIAKTHEIDAMIGTHAYLSGGPFLDVPLPYVLVLGGTDLNEFAREPEYHAVMTEAVESAYAVIAFNDEFTHRCRTLWPNTSGRVHRIPQSVVTGPSNFSLRARLGLAEDDILLLLPSGLRPVKDPLLLIDTVQRWHDTDPRVHLVITGLCYEDGYLDIVRRRQGTGRGVHYLGPLTRPDLHAAMLESTAVLNTSLSECSPNAILEAMDLGCPVLVRDIPGNTCLIEDGLTGLVFRTPAEFRSKAKRLVDDPRFGQRLGGRAREFVRAKHGVGQERVAYAAVFDRMRSELGIGFASRDRLLSVRGADLWVETFGVPDDPAVLLISGAGASMLAWDSVFCEKLAAEGRFVIRYDQRDTGRSVRSPLGAPDYTLRELAADAIGVLDGLDVESAHVAGASMGGMVAQLVALDHPERVDSLTLISTSPGGDDLPAMSPRLGVALDDLEVPDWSDRSAVVNQLVSKDALLTASADFDEAAARERAEQVFDRADGQLASAENHLFLDFGQPWRPRLREIIAPTLVVHGSADPMFPLAHANALAREIPDADLLVLYRAGHEPTAADRTTIAAALLRHTA